MKDKKVFTKGSIRIGKQLNEKQLAHGFTITGILMDQDDAGMEFSLTPFCNEIFRISDIGGDRIVDALLGEMAV